MRDAGDDEQVVGAAGLRRRGRGARRALHARRQPRQDRLAHGAGRDGVALRRGPLREQRRALARARDGEGRRAAVEVQLRGLPRRGQRGQVLEERRELDLDEVHDGGADRRDERRRGVAGGGEVDDLTPQVVLVAVHRDDLVVAEAAELLDDGAHRVLAEPGEQRRRDDEHVAAAERAGRVGHGERPRRAGADAGGAVDAQVVEHVRAGVAHADRGRRAGDQAVAALLAELGDDAERGGPRPLVGRLRPQRHGEADARAFADGGRDAAGGRCCAGCWAGPCRRRSPSARASAEAVDQPSRIADSTSGMPGPWSTTSTSSCPSLTAASSRPPRSAWITTFISAS